MSTADKLLYLQDTKTAIHDAIVSKGVEIPVGTVFRDYATKIESISTDSGGFVPTPEVWVRNTNWLAMPIIPDNEEKFLGLKAVFNTDTEYLAFIATGDYTVDWGDGSEPVNYTSGTKASYNYSYNTIAGPVQDDGSKQVIVTITPQEGNNLLSLNLNQAYPNFSRAIETYWLDLNISIPQATDKGFVLTSSGVYVRHRYLEQVRLHNPNSTITSLDSAFMLCTNLQSITITNTSTVTTMTSMFSGCSRLSTIPLLDTSSVTNMANMFASCSSLKSVPLLETSSVTNMAGMFSSCSSLKSVPLLETSSVTNMASMFSSCQSLSTIPLLDTSYVDTMDGMFINCGSLRWIPALVVNNVTNLNNIFYNCSTLSKIEATGFKYSFSINSSCLSAESLNELYTNLPVVTAKTITVTGNYGVSGDDPTIATAKGWTVVG